MKKTKVIIALLLATVMLAGGCSSSNVDIKDRKAEKSEKTADVTITEDDLKDVITGLEDHYVLQGAKNIDYLYGIEYDDSIIEQVDVNADQVQVEEVGDYDIIYTVSVNVTGYLEYQEQTGEETVKATDSDKNEIKDVEVKKKITVVEENEATKLADDNNVVWKDNNESVDKSTGEAVEVKEEQPVSIEKESRYYESRFTEEGRKKSESNTKSDTAKKENTSNKKNDNKNTAASHTHNWVAITDTVHHKAEYKNEPVYTTVIDYEDQPVYATKVVCGCGKEFDTVEEWGNHSIDCDYGYDIRKKQIDTKRVVVGSHQEQTGTKPVLVKAAYDETIITGYKCSSCGETKSK